MAGKISDGCNFVHWWKMLPEYPEGLCVRSDDCYHVSFFFCSCLLMMPSQAKFLHCKHQPLCEADRCTEDRWKQKQEKNEVIYFDMQQNICLKHHYNQGFSRRGKPLTFTCTKTEEKHLNKALSLYSSLIIRLIMLILY